MHVEIGVSDLARSREFYEGLLGGPAGIELVEVGAGDLGGWVDDDLQRGMRHVGFKVGDVDLQAERLRDAGVEFKLEPLDAVGDVRLAFFWDPDGTLLEIVDGHLSYHEVYSPAIAERERAAAAGRPRSAGPTFDHVAITVEDLDATVAFYGYETIGRVDHGQDPRGFGITYLQAGDAILEVFTFTAPKTANPWTPEEPRLGLRAIGIEGGLRLDPDGIPLRGIS